MLTLVHWEIIRQTHHQTLVFVMYVPSNYGKTTGFLHRVTMICSTDVCSMGKKEPSALERCPLIITFLRTQYQKHVTLMLEQLPCSPGYFE